MARTLDAKGTPLRANQPYHLRHADCPCCAYTASASRLQSRWVELGRRNPMVSKGNRKAGNGSRSDFRSAATVQLAAAFGDGLFDAPANPQVVFLVTLIDASASAGLAIMEERQAVSVAAPATDSRLPLLTRRAACICIRTVRALDLRYQSFHSPKPILRSERLPSPIALTKAHDFRVLSTIYLNFEINCFNFLN